MSKGVTVRIDCTAGAYAYVTYKESGKVEVRYYDAGALHPHFFLARNRQELSKALRSAMNKGLVNF